tara:strand:+ start:34982 stop:35161 length:180 start_codon:yes stop_codon:yes gene_type:complete
MDKNNPPIYPIIKFKINIEKERTKYIDTLYEKINKNTILNYKLFGVNFSKNYFDLNNSN